MKRRGTALIENPLGYGIPPLTLSLSAAIIYLVRNESTGNHSQARDITRMIQEYVLKNYNQQLSLSEICPDVNFSLSNISIIFEKTPE